MDSPRILRIVHLPFYDDNPYQALLMDAQRKRGHSTWAGGGGGNFLRTALFDWKADVLHFHWIHPYLVRPSLIGSILRSLRFLVGAMILRASGVRILWTIHNLSNHDRLHSSCEQIFSSAFAKLADHCFVHSEMAKEQAIDCFNLDPKNISVISHGNYIDLYPQLPNRENARKDLSLPPESTTILFFGRVAPYKGISDLIDAFSRQHHNIHLVIAGNPISEEAGKFVTKAAESNPQIHLHLHRISDSDLPSYFAAADAVVFPFKTILASGSIILAMSLGKAIIAPRLAVLTETVPPNGAVWFNTEDTGGLAKAIESISELDTATAGIANRSRAEQWDWPSIAAAIEDRIVLEQQ